MAIQLPAFVRMLSDGYQEQSDYGTKREAMDGLAKQRPRWSAPIVTRTIRLFVGGVEARLAMDRFIRVDLAGCSRWFNFRDPVSGQVQRGQFVAESLEWSADGPLWFLGAQLISVPVGPVGSDFWEQAAWGSPAGQQAWQFDAWGI